MKAEDEIFELKRRLLKNGISMEQVAALRAEGELVLTEFASMTVEHFAISTRNVIQESDLCEADKHALTEQIVAIGSVQFPPAGIRTKRGGRESKMRKSKRPRILTAEQFGRLMQAEWRKVWRDLDKRYAQSKAP